jgi:hypothetical protein
MKILSTDGLTKLIQLIKNGFISVDDTVTTTTTDIKTINNTSLLSSGNIDVLQNTAPGPQALTIFGTAQTAGYGTNVGYASSARLFSNAFGYNAKATGERAEAFGGNCTASGNWSIKIGHTGTASGDYSIAIGSEASASANYAIQLGYGTNSTANSLQIGFGTDNNYTLLDGTTGLIPDTRISSNIARTSSVADTDLSNLSTTGQAVIDGKVSKSGDTMTGALNINVDTQNQLVLVNPYITKGTTPSERKYYGLYFNDSQNLSADDWQDTRIGCIETDVDTNGTVSTSVQAVQNTSDNTASAAALKLRMTSSGTASCTFPDTTCCDGQWVEKYLAVFGGVTAIGGDDYSISSYLPNDGKAYEVLACMQMNDDGTTSGTDCAAAVGNVSKPVENNCFRIYGNSDKGIWKPRFNGVLVFLGNQRKVYYQITGRALQQGLVLWFFGYRRIGTNS